MSSKPTFMSCLRWIFLIAFIAGCISRMPESTQLQEAIVPLPYRLSLALYTEPDFIAWPRALQTALHIAGQHQSADFYQQTVAIASESEGDSVIVTDVAYGHLLSPDKKHLFIRSHVWGGALLDWFVLQNDTLKNVCHFEMPGSSYGDDTLRDVNGDGNADFLVHRHPISGCCMRDLSSTFLYLPETGGFSDEYEFINALFLPEEKLIRGLNYGHIEEVSAYTYRWNGLQLDTVEYIYPWKGHWGKFIRTSNQVYGDPNPNDGEVLYAFPEAYRKVEGIIWFDE